MSLATKEQKTLNPRIQHLLLQHRAWWRRYWGVALVVGFLAWVEIWSQARLEGHRYVFSLQDGVVESADRSEGGPGQQLIDQAAVICEKNGWAFDRERATVVGVAMPDETQAEAMSDEPQEYLVICATQDTDSRLVFDESGRLLRSSMRRSQETESPASARITVQDSLLAAALFQSCPGLDNPKVYAISRSGVHDGTAVGSQMTAEVVDARGGAYICRLAVQGERLARVELTGALSLDPLSKDNGVGVLFLNFLVMLLAVFVVTYAESCLASLTHKDLFIALVV
ncbi:MAG: hypothetical protein KDC10_08970, partial [Calditrichaeota bacterium]|nr:hypothetical protein [Calditrichota bacterium]